MNIFTTKKYLYAIVGILLGIGSPLGAITLRVMLFQDPEPGWLSNELTDYGFFYLYMSIGSTLVLAISGMYLGYKSDNLKQKEREYYQASIHDPLTNLYNRRFFDNRMAQEFERAVRYDSALSCLMIDIDRFKQVNDTFGHDVGDVVLRKLSETIIKRVREFDILARYGGEEFTLLLPQTHMHNSYSLAEQIRTDVEKIDIVVGSAKDPIETCSFTISIGISGIPDNGAETREQLVKQADQALYMAKQNGRNQSVIFSAEVKQLDR